MVGKLNIPDEDLYPGDIVRAEYEILTANQTILDMIVSDIKNTIATDPRFDYQGSSLKTVGDVERGRDVQYLVVWVQVRKTLRGSAMPLQLASSLGAAVLAVSIVVVVALLVHGVDNWSNNVVLVHASKERQAVIDNPDLTPEQKQAMLDQLAQQESSSEPPTLGAGLSALGGSLITAAIVIGVLWAVSLSLRARPRVSEY